MISWPSSVTLVQACISSATRVEAIRGDGSLETWAVIDLAICAAMSRALKPRAYNDNTTASMLGNHRFRLARSWLEAASRSCGTRWLPTWPVQRFGALPGCGSCPGSDRPDRAGHSPDAQPSPSKESRAPP